jgi:hypothetical protein
LVVPGGGGEVQETRWVKWAEDAQEEEEKWAGDRECGGWGLEAVRRQ